LGPQPWMRRALEQDGLLVPGAVLTEAGVAAPLIDPEQALLFDITAMRSPLIPPTERREPCPPRRPRDGRRPHPATRATRTTRSWRCCSSRRPPSVCWHSWCRLC